MHESGAGWVARRRRAARRCTYLVVALMPAGAAMARAAQAPVTQAPPATPVATVSEVGILVHDKSKPDSDPTAMRLVRSTDRIEACLGIEFGYRLDLTGLTPGAMVTVDKVVSTPPMRKPDGKISRGYTREFPVEVPGDGVLVAYEGFGFDYDYELVPGDWTIEMWMSGKKLATRTFVVSSCTQPPQ